MNDISSKPIILHEQSLASFMSELFALPSGVSVAVDSSCKTILHNHAASAFLRVDEGANFSMTADAPPPVRTYDLHGKEIPPEELSLQKAIAERKANKQIVELEWPDGTRKIAVWNSKPILDPAGAVIGAVSISEEITELIMEERRSRIEQNLLRVELERLDRLEHVSQLAAGISHEVRNPLTTVKGFLQLMRLKKGYHQDRELFGMLLDELERANEIISDYLSLTRFHARKLEDGNLAKVIAQLSPLLDNDAFLTRKHLSLRLVNIPDIQMDEKEIKQLLLNLVRNAIEATPVGGTVAVETFMTPAAVGFRVTDEGSGIPEEITSRLGTPFVTTKPNGTGIGLAICYDIAKRHHAAITVQTSADGTVFSVEFPTVTDRNAADDRTSS
ncbi:ATP-binding protein [Paenibacillus xanthanilyticus]|uniref:histidine kinase n=1 Tax=Paenibacillus xanthanilyticus TaxID=1783531 RepID=A0ABV8K664_9BACL